MGSGCGGSVCDGLLLPRVDCLLVTSGVLIGLLPIGCMLGRLVCTLVCDVVVVVGGV